MNGLNLSGTLKDFLNSINVENFTDDPFYDITFCGLSNAEIYFTEKFDNTKKYKKDDAVLFKDKSTNKRNKVFNCVKDLEATGLPPTQDKEHWEEDEYENSSRKIYTDNIDACIKQINPMSLPYQLNKIWDINKEWCKDFIFLILSSEIMGTFMPKSLGIATSESITSLSQSIEIPDAIRNNEYLMIKCRDPYFGGRILDKIMELPFDLFNITQNIPFDDCWSGNRYW